MAREMILSKDTKLYSAAEPEGRTFLAGDQWPGDAWHERKGGGDKIAPNIEVMEELVEARKELGRLEMAIQGRDHSLAQLAAERDDAVTAKAANEQALADAQRERNDAVALTGEITAERDRNAQQAEAEKRRADGLDAQLTEAQATITRLTSELATANQATADANGRADGLASDLADAKAKIAAVDGDGDGSPGGSKPKAGK